MRATTVSKAVLLIAGAVVMLGGLTGCPGPLPGSSVLFVRADATGLLTGADWADAFTDLQSALDFAAQNGTLVTEIWVAAGTYKPAPPGGSRSASFHLPNNVGVYGGFAGTETSRDQRDFVANLTTLSGDLAGDDQGIVNNSENSYHVVVVDTKGATAILDGFIIRGGNANEGADTNGGGIVNRNASPTVVNCTFQSNTAVGSGGAMFTSNGSPTVTNCTFSDNTTMGSGGAILSFNSSPLLSHCQFSSNTARTGGAMFNLENSAPRISACTFTTNSANESGGAVSSNGGAPQFTDCSFESNNSNAAGAVNSFNGSTPLFRNCTFRSNTAQQDGGAMLNATNTTAGVVMCTFRDNSANRSGGAISNSTASNTAIVNCLFLNNSSLSSGGAVFNYLSTPAYANCVFSGNSSALGGAMVNRDQAATIIRNCTFNHNSGTLGGGLYNTLDSSPVLTNCILWDNTDSKTSPTDAQIRTDTGTPVVNYSCIQGGWTGSGGIGNVSTDPLFADALGPDGQAGTGDEDLRLGTGSPCIDSGDNTGVPEDTFDLDADQDRAEPLPLDLGGNPRFIDDPAAPDTGNGTPPIVDMGAYE